MKLSGKTLPEVIDILIKQIYNSLDLDKLLELAKTLTIDIHQQRYVQY